MSSPSVNKQSLLFIASLFLSILECGAKNYCSSNICRNTKQHTLCKFQAENPAKHCLDFAKTIKTDEDRHAILEKLNNRRNKVAAGEIKSLPASADMMKLSWNAELAIFAQRWADQCVQYSSPEMKDTCRDLDNVYVGQNIATIYGDSPGLTVTALVDVWYMELLSINESILSRFRASRDSGFNHYEYFSQLVWAESREVGCGGVKFRDRDGGNRTVYRLVCNFAPGGNRVNRTVYTYGVPCSRCPEDTVCDNVFKALCDKTIKQTSREETTEDESFTLKFDSSKAVSKVEELSNTDTTTTAIEITDSITETGDDTLTLYDYFSHVHDFTRQLVTAASTKHDCKDSLSVDNFIDLLRKRLNSDPGFMELLFSTKLPTLTGLIDSSFTDPSVAAFVSKLYSKKEPPTTMKITESDLLNSTLLVDLVEAVIFRSNGGIDKMQFTEEVEHTTQYSSDVSPVKIQAELARIQENSDFTGHYFFPEDDDEETSVETTEVYYDTSDIKDIMMEIEDIKKSTVTTDFLDEIFEADHVTESSTSATQLSPDDMNVYKSGHNVMKKFLEDITDKTPTPL